MAVHLSSRALIKWTLITILCGGMSFFWGFMFSGKSIIAMLLGMMTLALMFAFIESHPRYQGIRHRDPRLAWSLDLGVKIRCLVAIWGIVGSLLNFVFRYSGAVIEWVTGWPITVDVLIGMSVVHVVAWFLGVVDQTDIGQGYIGRGYNGLGPIEHELAIYVTTLITGLVHTVILGVLCGVIYLFLRLVRMKDKKQHDS